MLATYKRKANIASGIWLVSLVPLFLLISPEKGNIWGRGWDMSDMLLIAVFSVNGCAYLFALWAYARGKGYSGRVLGLLVLPIGLPIIALLRDKHPETGSLIDRKHSTTDAVKTWGKRVIENPNSAEAHCNLGFAYFKLEKHHDAINEYKEALRLEPDLAKAHTNLGGVYYALGKNREAIAEVKEAIRLKPDLAKGSSLLLAMAHKDLGIDYSKLGKHPEAIAEFKEAIRLKPDLVAMEGNLILVMAHYNLGLAYGKINIWQGAILEYKEAIRIQPDFAEAHYSLGMGYDKSNDGTNAIIHMKEAERLFATQGGNPEGLAYARKALQHLYDKYDYKP